jgi:hypothetical protein
MRGGPATERFAVANFPVQNPIESCAPFTPPTTGCTETCPNFEVVNRKSVIVLCAGRDGGCDSALFSWRRATASVSPAAVFAVIVTFAAKTVVGEKVALLTSGLTALPSAPPKDGFAAASFRSRASASCWQNAIPAATHNPDQ